MYSIKRNAKKLNCKDGCVAPSRYISLAAIKTTRRNGKQWLDARILFPTALSTHTYTQSVSSDCERYKWRTTISDETNKLTKRPYSISRQFELMSLCHLSPHAENEVTHNHFEATGKSIKLSDIRPTVLSHLNCHVIWHSLMPAPNLYCFLLIYFHIVFSLRAVTRSTNHNHSTRQRSIFCQPNESILAGTELLLGVPILPIVGLAVGVVWDKGKGRIDESVLAECRLQQIRFLDIGQSFGYGHVLVDEHRFTVQRHLRLLREFEWCCQSRSLGSSRSQQQHITTAHSSRQVSWLPTRRWEQEREGKRDISI